MIAAGQKIPSVTIKQATPEGGADVDPAELFAGKKVVMFSLPGAFTPTCSQKHLPGYVDELAQLKAKGVDIVACLSVNDAWVMKAWAEQHDALGKIVDARRRQRARSRRRSASSFDDPGHGRARAARGCSSIEDGIVKSVDMEAPGKFEVSSAEACMTKFG